MRGNWDHGENDTSAGLEQIREILFGAIERELERKVALVEAHLVTRANELHQEARRRTEVLEAHLGREGEALRSKMEHDIRETNEVLRKAVNEFRAGLESAEQRLLKLEESIARQQSELRHALLEQAKSSFDELERVREELIGVMRRELGFADEGSAVAEGSAGEGEVTSENEEHPAP